MFVRELISTPDPGAFFDLKTGKKISFYIDTEKSENIYEDIKCFDVICNAIKPTEKGITIGGEISSPEELAGNLTLIDIDWDTAKYSGKIAIAGIVDIDLGQ